MAGSWMHSVTDDGRLLSDVDLAAMLETGGDVWEYAEEAYGMVWFLAAAVSPAGGRTPKEWVEEARIRYREGIALSPGINGNLND
ncbi:hypothetical protein [Microbacterium maritypicum]|uniref:Uncharacterized protein n=1 Tax=Microbacterium maritypicum MF109 TaxID=1333857 RepID=T5KEF6_MICMQ|nr:hypothetical protein [Microbacterium liquefaciens]EQM74877.1 hypothetical protein L687_05300 [Microbacterium maritypicum MF109]